MGNLETYANEIAFIGSMLSGLEALGKSIGVSVKDLWQAIHPELTEDEINALIEATNADAAQRQARREQMTGDQSG